MGDEITYKELEDKVKKRLEYALNNGYNDDFVHARNLAATLINLIEAEKAEKEIKKI